MERFHADAAGSTLLYYSHECVCVHACVTSAVLAELSDRADCDF